MTTNEQPSRVSRTLGSQHKRLADELRAAGLSPHEAELLLSMRLGLPRHRLYLDAKREVPPDIAAVLESDLRRRLSGEPLQLVLGSVGFRGLELSVRPGVFIPRPETEVLVEQAVELASRTPGALLDLCCGSGAIACALAAELPTRRVVAVDASPAACELTRDNARRLGLAERIGVVRAGLAEALAGPFALIACNPPYIPSGDLRTLPAEVRDHDPAAALDGGPDGLSCYRRLAPELTRLLLPGGPAVLEIGEEQGEAVRGIFENTPGLERVEIQPDLTGRDRVAIARRAVD
ncbi:MAG: peptide chain release factor N(5)-glutamine methyltransferase [Candidatus Coatesbacteria bacterium]|nr:peptide chain release factor N(5)-glutamine methyltransferase [Candidatus Coatesbacteria bacterium]